MVVLFVYFGFMSLKTSVIQCCWKCDNLAYRLKSSYPLEQLDIFVRALCRTNNIIRHSKYVYQYLQTVLYSVCALVMSIKSFNGVQLFSINNFTADV